MGTVRRHARTCELPCCNCECARRHTHLFERVGSELISWAASGDMAPTLEAFGASAVSRLFDTAVSLTLAGMLMNVSTAMLLVVRTRRMKTKRRSMWRNLQTTAEGGRQPCQRDEHKQERLPTPSIPPHSPRQPLQKQLQQAPSEPAMSKAAAECDHTARVLAAPGHSPSCAHIGCSTFFLGTDQVAAALLA